MGCCSSKKEGMNKAKVGQYPPITTTQQGVATTYPGTEHVKHSVGDKEESTNEEKEGVQYPPFSTTLPGVATINPNPVTKPVNDSDEDKEEDTNEAKVGQDPTITTTQPKVATINPNPETEPVKDSVAEKEACKNEAKGGQDPPITTTQPGVATINPNPETELVNHPQQIPSSQNDPQPINLVPDEGNNPNRPYPQIKSVDSSESLLSIRSGSSSSSKNDSVSYQKEIDEDEQQKLDDKKAPQILPKQKEVVQAAVINVPEQQQQPIPMAPPIQLIPVQPEIPPYLVPSRVINLIMDKASPILQKAEILKTTSVSTVSTTISYLQQQIEKDQKAIQSDYTLAKQHFALSDKAETKRYLIEIKNKELMQIKRLIKILEISEEDDEIKKEKEREREFLQYLTFDSNGKVMNYLDIDYDLSKLEKEFRKNIQPHSS